MNHQLLISYYAANETHYLLSCTISFSLVILLSVLDVYVFITGVSIDEITLS